MKKYLFTNELSDDAEHYVAYRLRTQFEMEPMIRIEFRSGREWMNEVPDEPYFWAFTSKNGVRAVKPEYFKLPETEGVFCVGPKTAQMLSDRACEVSFPRKHDSEHLVEHIADCGADKVIHFRGNLSGNDLVESLQEKGIEAKGIEVYETVEVPRMIDLSDIKGIVFMSPSAIRVFLQDNEPDPDMPVFCIGNTTGSYASERGFSNIILPDESTIESLVQKIKEFD